MSDTGLHNDIARHSLPAAWPDLFQIQEQAAGCLGQAAAIVNRTAMAIWSCQAHILARELDLASRGFGAIAARNPAVRATCLEISRDDLDMVARDMHEIGRLAMACGTDLLAAYAEYLRETAAPTTRSGMVAE